MQTHKITRGLREPRDRGKPGKIEKPAKIEISTQSKEHDTMEP